MLNRLSLVLTIVLLFTAISPTYCQEASTSKTLELSFEKFDQDMKGGWRLLSNDGKYLQAARLIERYLQGRNDLTDFQRQILYFHAGQMFAMGDRPKMAISQFEKSRKAKDDFMKWNYYVNGTIAFLKGDMKLLKECRERVANNGMPLKMNKNLVVLDKLIAGSKSTYREIFEKLIEEIKKSEGSGGDSKKNTEPKSKSRGL